jgi:hypothetical protein
MGSMVINQLHSKLQGNDMKYTPRVSYSSLKLEIELIGGCKHGRI